MRLLQAIAGQPHGGAEAFFERLAIGLAASGVTQRLVIRRNPARAARLAAAGLAVVEAPFGGPFDFATRRLLRREIADFRADVVLSWMNRATRACAPGDFVHVARLGGYYDLKYYRHCHHLIANTRDIERYLVAQGWPAARAHYLPNFAAHGAVPPAAREVPRDRPLALALGRLHRNKGFDVLLEAMVLLPEFQLWLAGEGEERGALERLARDRRVAGRVRFLGWRDDAAALIAAADMLVSPSRHEPLGNVVIEAWAAGLPVIASASEGPRALLRDGATGLLVPLEDAGALAAAMRRLWAEPPLRAALAEAGRAAFAAAFAGPRVVGLYRDFLQAARR